MLVKLWGVYLKGIESQIIPIEIRLARGYKYYFIGLVDQSIKESIHRIESSLIQANYKMPRKKLVVSLLPIDIKKTGSQFDLPIAIGILIASQQIAASLIQDFLLIGGLSLDGKVLPVKGVLSMLFEAKKQGLKGVVISKDSVQEVHIIEGVEIILVGSISDVIDFFLGRTSGWTKVIPSTVNWQKKADLPEQNFYLKGQNQALRMLEIAAAGSHHVLMVGPPGAGKTYLANFFRFLLPSLSWEEALQSWTLFSVSGKNYKDKLNLKKPFRNPHHTITVGGLIGSGVNPVPGEISLAHKGVLFLDEIAEFKRIALEALRDPLESKKVVIARAKDTLIFPADFILIAAMNPCPCGYFRHPKKRCICSKNQIQKYISKISGPLLDRIDLQIEIPSVSDDDLMDSGKLIDISEIQTRIKTAQDFRMVRREKLQENLVLSSDGENRVVSDKMISPEAEDYLNLNIKKQHVSARSYDKIIQISRTIADLEGSLFIQQSHIAEAMAYRVLESLIK